MASEAGSKTDAPRKEEASTTTPTTRTTTLPLPLPASALATFSTRYRLLQRDPTLLEHEYEAAKESADDDPDFDARLTRSTSIVQARNRYRDVVTLDDTRVRLQSKSPDYINASFVGGGRFIAAQAPLRETTPDFWLMCWEHRVPCVVMLTRFEEPTPYGTIREKSSRYFPLEPGAASAQRHGDFSVECRDVSQVEGVPGLTSRTLVLRRADSSSATTTTTTAEEEREIQHLHFTAWPDFGRVHRDELAGFFRTMEMMKATMARGTPGAPPVVHCSAGIGRSGAFSAVALIQMRVEAGEATHVDVKSVVAELRSQRPGMVQTLEQYEMIYDAIAALAAVVPST